VGFKRINRLKYSWIKSINAPVSAAGNVSVPRLMSQVGRLREAVCVFMRLALKVVMQNDGDTLWRSVILLYLCPMLATGTETANTESSSVPGDGRAPVCVRGVQYVDGNYQQQECM
jgi:hypothetical protein